MKYNSVVLRRYISEEDLKSMVSKRSSKFDALAKISLDGAEIDEETFGTFLIMLRHANFMAFAPVILTAGGLYSMRAQEQTEGYKLQEELKKFDNLMNFLLDDMCDISFCIKGRKIVTNMPSLKFELIKKLHEIQKGNLLKPGLHTKPKAVPTKIIENLVPFAKYLKAEFRWTDTKIYQTLQILISRHDIDVDLTFIRQRLHNHI
jgi:hypothetical protein